MCNAKRCVLFAGFALVLLAGSAAADLRVYWTDWDTASGDMAVDRASMPGGVPESFGEPSSWPGPIAVESNFRLVFFVDGETIRVKSVDGGPVPDVLTGTTTITALALDDGGADTLYYTTADFRLQRADFNGNGITTILSGPLVVGAAWDLAVDKAHGRLYWVRNGGILRAFQDGTDRQQIVSEYGLKGVAVDESGGKVYFTDQTPPRIQRANLDGSGVETVLDLTDDPWRIRLDGLGKMYWAEAGDSPSPYARIKSANTDGTDVETIADLGSNWTEFIAVESGSYSCARTRVFGDVVVTGSVNFFDISQVVGCFQNDPVRCPEYIHRRADLSPCDAPTNTCRGDGSVDFRDIFTDVGAFQGLGCQ